MRVNNIALSLKFLLLVVTNFTLFSVRARLSYNIQTYKNLHTKAGNRLYIIYGIYY